MRLDSVSLKGLLRFADPVTIPFRDLPAGVIAITGANGEGKTTILEAAFAALYRHWPSRDGELVDYATSRDSSLEAAFTLDGRGLFVARLSLDGPKRGTDAALVQVLEGKEFTLNHKGQATGFDACVAGLDLPSEDLMLASTFRAQNGRGNFIGLGKKDRKERFAELLGLQHYAAKAETAAKATARLDAAILECQAQARMLRPAVDDVIDEQLGEHEGTTRCAIATAQVELRQIEATLHELKAAREQHEATHVAYLEAAQRLHALEQRIAECGQLVDELERQKGTHAARYVEDAARIEQKRDTDLAATEQLIRNNETVIANRASIEAAVATIAALTDARTAADESRQQAQADLAAATARRRALEQRLAKLATVEQQRERTKVDADVLQTVPCGGQGDYATCGFLVNALNAVVKLPGYDAALAEKVELADGVATATQEVEDAERRLTETAAHLRAIAADAAKAKPFADRAAPLAAATARIEELRRQLDTIRTDADAALQALRTRHEQHVVDLDRRRFITQGDIEAAARTRDEWVARVAETEDGHAQAVLAQVDIERTEAGRDRARDNLARLQAHRDELAAERARFDVAKATFANLVDRIERLGSERAGWAFFAQAFGRDGLPVLEIDAAGPTISAFTNELLEVCFGPRFTVDLVTQQARVDGKGAKEAFTVAVLDNLRGGEPRDVADLSGGEQVIVAEALMNAIALYGNTRTGVPMRTCWRDETTGALDPENAVRYLQMLRKVLTLGQYHQLVFVTHNQDVAAMADAQLRVHGGRVDVLLPPFSEAA